MNRNAISCTDPGGSGLHSAARNASVAPLLAVAED
jgi:hypothetical protein